MMIFSVLMFLIATTMLKATLAKPETYVVRPDVLQRYPVRTNPFEPPVYSPIFMPNLPPIYPLNLPSIYPLNLPPIYPQNLPPIDTLPPYYRKSGTNRYTRDKLDGHDGK